MKLPHCFGSLLLTVLIGCSSTDQRNPVKPILKVSENSRYLIFENGEPFFWLGGTTWGMSEWLTREDIDYYLDNRKEKGFNLVQISLFWGKRVDDPVNFSINPPNAYGFQAFVEVEGEPVPCQPCIMEGGTPQSPNDYWDHVEYIIQAAEKRDIIVALLPVWGRRYVNATHKGFSSNLFSIQAMNGYGNFLGQRFQDYSNIIWVMGGDVAADAGGDFLHHYRSMAEGIITGIAGETVQWDEESPLWDYALMTYHPDGTPLLNSSEWFHNDPWLDFNMIETYQSRNMVYKAVQHDYILDSPVKPTVMGEPAYEGERKPTGFSTGVQMRRQAYHSFFGGAAGFTYGAFRDKEGNGPLFSPYEGWKKLLDMEGANSMKFVKSFCLNHNWPHWIPVHDMIMSNLGNGEMQKVAVIAESTGECFIYYPDNSHSQLELSKYFKEAEKVFVQWFNTASGTYSVKSQLAVSEEDIYLSPPADWSEAILILSACIGR